ncbi:MAG: 50S ribosomal protein L19 [Lentisphaerae bacterium]|nr:50S ribosomal protein L19 [Lentisphaerota bacterium]
MSTSILKAIDLENRKKEPLAGFAVGDSVKVLIKIKEGDKERLQAFAGTVIARKGSGATETFTVRQICFGEGVERVFPLHSPNLAGLEVEDRVKRKRAKLYYLRKRTGKTANLETQPA